MPERQIYLLSPRELSPETIAVAFAKTSRSPESFREIAATLNDEKSAKFHEKWVVGYGHASVAEHAVLHLAFENVSRLAIESIESNRLASYTEKSTRYQKWSPDDFFIPQELDGHPLRQQYVDTCHLLFETYRESLDPVRAVVMARAKRKEGETDEALDRRIRSQYVDVCRFLLPAASLANVGMTANARVLENAIRKMLSHRLAEVRAIGEQIKAVSQAEIPTLVKYADAVPYLQESASDICRTNDLSGSSSSATTDWCSLVDYDIEGENRVLAAASFRFGESSYARAFQQVCTFSEQERQQMANALMGRLQEHDIPLRELEHCSYTFELVMDQGAYIEFKRHRMMTQTPQQLTARIGYAMPLLMEEAGMRSRYDAAMENAAQTYEKLYSLNPFVAQYGVPNAFNRRVLATFNLREALAFGQLRSAKNAHFSLRRIASRIAKEISLVHPLLGAYLMKSLPSDAKWAEIEAANFFRTH